MIAFPSNAERMLPDESERRKIFYWLQMVSSLTAWRRVLAFYEAWAIATENSLRIADEKGWADKTSLTRSEYALILKCLAHCEEGVRRLAQGDKRVFKFDANGEFAMAERMLSHWVEMLNRIEIGESRVNPCIPLWEPFCEALEALVSAWRECGANVLESRYFEDPAPNVYGEPLVPLLRIMRFPPRLEPVPDPADNAFVRTGQSIPCSGIWEPITVARASKTSMLSMFTRTPDPQPPFAMASVMNYLHGGSNAPQAAVETADDIVEFDTTWRLLWRDDRYLDGGVPAIEAGYQFLQPRVGQEQRMARASSEEMVGAESGDPAAASGKWLVASDPGASVSLQKGEKLPLHRGHEVRWVLAKN